MIQAYFIHLLILIGIYSILAVSLNLVLGYTGLLNLGHIAFFGIGAYTSALLTMKGVPFIFSFLLAGLVASVFGYLLVLATKRLKGDYLALATLGFSFVVYSLFLNLEFTRGPLGIPGIPKPSLFGFAINSNFQYFLFVLVVAVISIYLIKKIVDSPFGRLLQATRDNELKLKTLGKNTGNLKIKAMMISAFFAGLAGSLYAHYITYIDPSSFYLADIILILVIVIVGGLASIEGSIFATFFILLIPEALRFLELPSSVIGPMRQIIYAIILIGILMFKPRGLLGGVDLG
jgi:branched-chain amino acid transport system permease protein